MTMLGLWMLQATPPVEGPEAARPSTAETSEPPTGDGMRRAGVVLTAIGGAFLVGGAGMFIAEASCRASHAADPHLSGECWWFVQGLWMAPVGVLTTSVGVPLLVAGLRRHRRWRTWRDQHGLALRPRVQRTQGGLVVGLELRF